MRTARFAFVILTLCLVPTLHGESLADVLAAHQLPANLLPAAESAQQITSAAVSPDNIPFLLAYYDDDGAQTLPSKLHVLRYDGRTGSLLQATLSGTDTSQHDGKIPIRRVSDICLGAAVNIAEKNAIITIDTHITPSAGCVFLLNSNLAFIAELNGWVLARMDGYILLEQSEIHFAPTHPARLSIYNSKNKRLTKIYPAKQDAARDQFSRELEKHFPSQQWCREHNNACDARRFTTGIEHVNVREKEQTFEFEARMEAEGLGADAERAVPSKTVRYSCHLENGHWLLSAR